MAKGKQGLTLTQRAVMWAGSKVFHLADSTAVKMITGGQTNTGVHVGPDAAMRTSAVWGCVRVLAETVGSLPMAVYERDRAGNAVRADDHPVAQVLCGVPNEDMTPQEVVETKMQNLGVQGNAYSIIDKNGAGNLSMVTPVPSCHVDPRMEPDGSILYHINDRGRMETFPAEKVWHVKGFGNNGLIGFSPVGYARQSVGISLATEEFGARFFKDGAKTSGIVTADQWLTKDQRTDARETLSTLWQGLVNAHKVQLLEGGMKYQNVTMPLQDAQFLETRRFQIEEICRIYRVPPHKVADLSRSTNNNIEHQSLEFLEAILPYLIRFEQTAQRRLFKASDRGRYFLRFNFEGLLRADSVSRAQLYSVMLQNGVYNRNEVRALENRPKSDAPGMEDYTVQSNMLFVEALGKLAAGGGKNGN